MLRLSEIKLPLDHSDDDLQREILRTLSIDAADLVSFSIFKRSHDARKRGRIMLIYQLDVVLARPEPKAASWKVLQRCREWAPAPTPAISLSPSH